LRQLAEHRPGGQGFGAEGARLRIRGRRLPDRLRPRGRPAGARGLAGGLGQELQRQPPQLSLRKLRENNRQDAKTSRQLLEELFQEAPARPWRLGGSFNRPPDQRFSLRRDSKLILLSSDRQRGTRCALSESGLAWISSRSWAP